MSLAKYDSFTLSGIDREGHPLNKKLAHKFNPIDSTHFWSYPQATLGSDERPPIYSGYKEARYLMRNGDLETLKHLTDESFSFVAKVFESVNAPEPAGAERLVRLRLSDDLQQWRAQQHQEGKILPAKGTGLKQVSKEVLEILGASDWPRAMTTVSALYGVGIVDLVIGAPDVQTMFSNYITDMAFYYEHGYGHVFPDLDVLIDNALRDKHALETAGGAMRRKAVETGIRYIKGKISMEEENMTNLAYISARMDRKTMQTLSLCESSLIGLGAEAMFRGFDTGSVMNDLVFSSPNTDIVDVGSDIVNSELMNSILNAADIANTGEVSEEALRRVYDAYAHAGARLLTERWSDPAGQTCGWLYVWHIVNDRHKFLRRAILGYPKARRGPGEQREADLDEAFDERLHTTGFSRPLKNACNGRDTCDQVLDFLDHSNNAALLSELWESLVTSPLKYVRNGVVDEKHESDMEESIRVAVAKMYREGLILELCWAVSHANHHGWQVNYLFEAAMFGSILDDGAHIGKLDRPDVQ